MRGCVVLSLLFFACSSSDDATTSTPTAADAGNSGTDSGPSTDAGGGGSDAAIEAGPDPKKACDTLTADVTMTQTKITLGAANKHPFAEAPTATGGTVVDGTYRLSTIDYYNDGAGTTLGEVQGTIVLSGGLWEIVSKTGDGLGSSNESNGGGSYTISDGKFFWKNGCGVITAGPTTGGVTPLQGPFTATPTTLTFIVNNGANVIMKSTYTKD